MLQLLIDLLGRAIDDVQETGDGQSKSKQEALQTMVQSQQENKSPSEDWSGNNRQERY